MAALDFTRFRALTLDCYGTLVDWEAGLLATLGALLELHGKSVPEERIVATYAEIEAQVEAGPHRRYREVLAQVVDGLGKEFGFSPSGPERNCVSESIQYWEPFPDTAEALRRLKEKFKLVIISNIDDDLFALTAPKLGVEFDAVVTAQQVGAYKPSKRNFEQALESIGEPVEAVLHVAQSLYHDIQPAKGLGFATVWVNRESTRRNVGVAPRVDVVPDLEVPDLKSLAELAHPKS